MRIPNYSLQAAQAKLTFLKSLQNFRGTLQCEQNRLNAAYARQGCNPTQVASYKICGVTNLEPQVIAGNALLQRLSRQCFTALVDYIHFTLLSSHPQIVALLQSISAQQDWAAVKAKATAMKDQAQAEPLDDQSDLQSKIDALVHNISLNVGMSGGADSTLVLVLACALRDKYGYPVLAIHCIHGLDPDDEIWLQHNRQLTDALAVSLVTPTLNIQYGAGGSPEDISRKERYKALLQLTRKEQDCLLLGHQADDQVENFLLALKRGSGPQGIAGMRLVTLDERGVLLRPLLDLHKLEVEQMLTDLGYNYVYDLSNGYLKFERNFMRLKVLPVLRERFAGIDKAILRSQSLCGFEHDLALRYVKEQLPQHLKAVSYPPFYALQLTNLQDLSLNTLLIRSFLNLFCSDVDYNLVERCYELLLSPHDANGCLKVGSSPFLAATFLNYLCLYVPFSAQELSMFKGKYLLRAGETLQLGSLAFSLEPYTLLEDPEAQACAQLSNLPSSSLTESLAKSLSDSSSESLSGLLSSSNHLGMIETAIKVVNAAQSAASAYIDSAKRGSALSYRAAWGAKPKSGRGALRFEEAQGAAAAALSLEQVQSALRQGYFYVPLTYMSAAEYQSLLASGEYRNALLDSVQPTLAAASSIAASLPTQSDRSELKDSLQLSFKTDQAELSDRHTYHFLHSHQSIPGQESGSLDQVVVQLNFDYTQSRKLKPVTRAHSREIKKLFIEHEIAPWQRAGIPLVENLPHPGALAHPLALGDVFSVTLPDLPALEQAPQTTTATTSAARHTGRAIRLYRLKCQRI